MVLTVQPPHRINPFITGILHKCHYRFSFLGIIGGGHIILGFIQQQVDLSFSPDPFTVITHVITGLYFRSQLGDAFPVHSNNTCGDQLICLTPGADTRCGNVFIKPDPVVAC